MIFFRNLFTGPCGKAYELGRVMSAWAMVTYSGAFLYALIAKGAVPDWSNLGVGYGGVMAGAGALIAAKDIARAKSLATPVQGAAPPA